MSIVKHIKKSIRYQYLFSYFVAFMLAGTIISGIMFSISVKEIMKANTNTAANNLNNAAIDFQLQYNLLKDITKKIQFELPYRPSYFLRNKYYETELLSSLAKYESYSPLIQEYFLYYHDFSILYSGQGTLFDIDTYFSKKMKWQDYQKVWQEIQESRETTVLISDGNGEKQVLFVFPIEIFGTPSISSSATVVFIMPHSVLQTWMATFGLKGKSLQVTYDDEVLFYITDNNIYKNSPVEFFNLPGADKIYSTLSSDQQFQLSASADQIIDQTILTNYHITIAIIAALIIPLLLCLAVYLSYKSYRPIKKLQDMIVPTSENDSENEFHRIADAFEKLLEIEKNYQQDINRQKSALKHQMVDIILNGGINHMIQSKALEIGIILSKDYYYVLAVNVGPTEKNIYDELEKLKDLINCDLFIGELGADHCINLLIGLANSQLEKKQFLDMISDFFDKLSITTFVGCSESVDSIEQMSTALLQAHSSLYEARCSRKRIFIFENAKKNPDDILLQLENMPHVIYISLKNKQFLEAQVDLQQCLNLLNSSTHSTVFLRYFYDNMMLSLNKITRELGTELSQEQNLAIIMSPSVENFIQTCSELIDWLHSFVLNKSSKAANSAQEIIDFIQLNYCNYDMSLNLIKERFGYNIPQLSVMIKDTIGISFRSYIVSLRMEKARELLKTHHTVSEISDMVGYSSVSHFTKTFRIYFGDKPSQFR